MRDVEFTVRLSFAVDENVTFEQLGQFVREAIGAKLDDELVAHDHGAPMPRIAYNGDPVEEVLWEE